MGSRITHHHRRAAASHVGGELAGAVTIGPAGDVGLLGWEPQHPAELARLAVSPVFQDRLPTDILRDGPTPTFAEIWSKKQLRFKI